MNTRTNPRLACKNQQPEYMNIKWGCRGPGINRDVELQNVNIMDTPAI